MTVVTSPLYQQLGLFFFSHLSGPASLGSAGDLLSFGSNSARRKPAHAVNPEEPSARARPSSPTFASARDFRNPLFFLLFFRGQKRRHLEFPHLDVRGVAMFNDSDTIDDFLSPTETTTGRQLGKFRPKARAKTVKVVSASTKTSDVARDVSASLEPVALDSHSELETEQAHLQPCTSSGSIENLCQDESTSLSLNTSNDDPLKLTEVMFNDLDSVDDFLCPMETTKEQQLGNFRPKVRAKTAKVVSASTKTSDDAQHVSAPLESIAHDAHSELQTDTTCFQSCMSSCSTVSCQHKSMPESVQQPEDMQTELVASQGKHADNVQLNEGNFCQDENTSITLNTSDDVPLKIVGIEEITDNIDHGTIVSEQSIMSDVMLRPLEVLMPDDDLHPSSSDLQEEIEALCGLESLDNLSVHHGSKMEVGKVSKFKPKVTKLPSKKATIKSVSFILPDASCSAIPVESISAMDTSSIQATIHDPTDNSLHTSDTASDWNGEHQVDYARIGEENNGENELPRVPKGIDVMSEFQFIEEPNPQNLERTTSENDTNAGATISTRKLRKRTVKSRAGNLEGTIDGDCGAEIDESQSNDGQEDENMPKPKSASRKRKGQTTEGPKPAKRGKKVSSITDSSVVESSKKKFPQCTRRKRRQVNKILLQTPEEEIDRRQICIKDLIMLTEAKERISTKEPTATGNLFSNQSSLDDNGLFGDDEEMSRSGGVTNYPNEPTTKKLNYHSYSNRLPTVRWSKSETQLLYEEDGTRGHQTMLAIRQFGSDFEMIQQLFPNRTRHQIKLKFKIVERKHPLQVRDALFHRSEDFSHVMQVIKMVQEKAETSAKEETNDDQENASQCNVDTNEKELEGIADEGDDYGGKDEDAGYPDFDEHEWDSCTYRCEKEEDSIRDF
ncbi:uncharacterized protein LOC122027135 isoform X1 [Zingiber officinale]|uniref:uncharacterized protein LOC122027135 isoform X1 n=1 Tax=Zingiber officinale TaxID=94328 RepID=UPI001C4D6279|nr:uncharacterized protein LOC122027135 isoform X1 [Zingiber officinale]